MALPVPFLLRCAYMVLGSMALEPCLHFFWYLLETFPQSTADGMRLALVVTTDNLNGNCMQVSPSPFSLLHCHGKEKAWLSLDSGSPSLLH
ncbi:unnamed protein product [Coffea canephora]|uniref:Uncharacterized protein n=1 Tax=Coffea canephora TaxID=49390 RepID=A0A068V9N9_COFCA|nr:unnamed protein product [Coffea canephora]